MADFDRTRSFVERYVIERATHFRLGFEREDAWTAILDGKTVYEGIGRMAKDPDANQAGTATQGPSSQAMGATGPIMQSRGSTAAYRPPTPGMANPVKHAAPVSPAFPVNNAPANHAAAKATAGPSSKLALHESWADRLFAAVMGKEST